MSTQTTRIGIGTKIVVAERPYGGKGREVCRGTIVRETKARWFDDNGSQYDKKTLRLVPKYMDNNRMAVAADEFDALPADAT